MPDFLLALYKCSLYREVFKMDTWSALTCFALKIMSIFDVYDDVYDDDM